MTRPKKSKETTLAVRAVRTEQADKAVYAFFVAGADLLKIAEHVAGRESMAFDKQDAFIWNVRLQTGKQ